MVLAVGEHVDVLYHHQILGVGLLVKGLVEHLRDLGVGVVHALEYFFVHSGHPLGRLLESFPVRVVPQSLQNTADVICDFLCVDHPRHLSCLDPR